MITVREIIEHLGTGELTLLMEGGQDMLDCAEIDTWERGVPKKEYPTVIRHLNLCLLDLHSKFLLNEKVANLMEVPGITMYCLDPKFAVSTAHPDVPTPYLLDTPEDPFQGDVMQITGVHDAYGEERPVNDATECNSIYLPNYKTVQVPNPTDGALMFVSYRSRPQKIDPADVGLLDVEIHIPPIFLEAILCYIAGRAFGSRSADGQPVGNLFKAEYLNKLSEIKIAGIVRDRYTPRSGGFMHGGWV